MLISHYDTWPDPSLCR